MCQINFFFFQPMKNPILRFCARNNYDLFDLLATVSVYYRSSINHKQQWQQAYGSACQKHSNAFSLLYFSPFSHLPRSKLWYKWSVVSFL